MISSRRSLTMTITITAFERSPDGGKGLARDTRVRWALEEVGLPYEVRLVSFRTMRKAISPYSRQGRSCSTSPSAVRAAAGRCQRPGARHHMDVCRAQHGG